MYSYKTISLLDQNKETVLTSTFVVFCDYSHICRPISLTVLLLERVVPQKGPNQYLKKISFKGVQLGDNFCCIEFHPLSLTDSSLKCQLRLIPMNTKCNRHLDIGIDRLWRRFFNFFNDYYLQYPKEINKTYNQTKE